jgi:hypothetical protein
MDEPCCTLRRWTSHEGARPERGAHPVQTLHEPGPGKLRTSSHSIRRRDPEARVQTPKHLGSGVWVGEEWPRQRRRGTSCGRPSRRRGGTPRACAFRPVPRHESGSVGSFIIGIPIRFLNRLRTRVPRGLKGCGGPRAIRRPLRIPPRCPGSRPPVVGRGHVSLSANLDTWHSEPFTAINLRALNESSSTAPASQATRAVQ